MTDEEVVTREGNRIKCAPLEWLPLEHLLFNLNPTDRTDLLGQSPTTNVLAIAAAIMSAEKQIAWTITINGRPSGALGVFQERPGSWSLWAFGIDRPDIALLILGRIFEQAIPHIRKHNGWSIRCRTRFDHSANVTHLRLLGFKPEALLKNWGTDRSTYLQFVYHLEDEPAERHVSEANSLQANAPQHLLL